MSAHVALAHPAVLTNSDNLMARLETAMPHSASPEAAELSSHTISDPFYGTETLDPVADAVIIATLRSPFFQRLHGTLQHGISPLIGLCPTNVTRHEHSVGAMLMVRRAGASVEEQMAALLHDVCHTALSHVIDGVFGRVVHEDDKLDVLSRTDIPAILTAHGLNSERVFHEENFAMLEQDAPALCADRGDYGIRDAVCFGQLSHDDARLIAADITSHNGRLAFKTLALAKQMAEAYNATDKIAWSNPVHAVNYRFAAAAIRQAFEDKVISMLDLWSMDDRTFWFDAIEKSTSERVRELATKVRGDVVLDEVVQDGDVTLSLKVRTIDPDVCQYSNDGSVTGVTPVSALDADFARRAAAYRASKAEPKHFRIRYPSM